MLPLEDEITPDIYRTMQVIRRISESGKSSLSMALGISRPTANSYVDILVKNNLLLDKKTMNVNASFGYMLGVAIGSRRIRTVLLDMSFNAVKLPILKAWGLTGLGERPFEEGISASSHENDAVKAARDETLVFDIQEQTFDEICKYLNDLLEAVKNWSEKSGHSLLGIGFAIQGTVNPQNGQVVNSPNLPWLNGKNAKDLIRGRSLDYFEKNNIPLIFDTTARGALIAEREFLYRPSANCSRNLADADNVALVYMGSGISFAASLGGRMVFGASGYLGELGHIQVPAESDEYRDKSCTCGQTGCLQAILQQGVFKANSLEEYREKTSKKALEAFQGENPAGYKMLLQEIGYIMNLLINMLNLDVLLFTGRLFNCMPDITNDLNIIKASNTLPYAGNDCTVLEGFRRANSAPYGMAMRACALRFGVHEVTWPKLYISSVNTTAYLF